MFDVLTKIMRTTLAIDDDVLVAAKAIAQQERRSVGEVVSELARRALRRGEPARQRNGMTLLARGDDQAVVTLDVVNALRDELP
jgi:hypothetical protein